MQTTFEMESVFTADRETTAAVGMWVFLASAGALFGSLLASYAMLRARQPEWPRPPGGLAGACTALILASSATLAAARLRANRGDSARGAVAATAGLGALFLGLQALLWKAVWAGSAGEGLMRSLLALLIGCHAAHVLAGLTTLAAAAATPEGEAFAVRLRVAELFWHFLDAAWLAVYLTMFWL